MKLVRARDFTGTRPWEALDVAAIDDVKVRLHWTDAPYRWHRNDGVEVFAVVDGTVDMRVRDAAGERVVTLSTGDAFVAEDGDEHLAEPRGVARILVIERRGSD
jgi:mannose-6-phosphate isomerase-like protein (cupin superfamily)